MTAPIVLLVEDSPTQAEETRRILEEAGCCVRTESDGQTALAALKREPAQVVLSDIVLPGMDGYGLCRRIKRAGPAPHGAESPEQHSAERTRSQQRGDIMKGMTARRIGVALAISAWMMMSVPALFADTIRIGAILDLSGNAAAGGQSIRDGLLLAVDEVNKRGGVNGSRIEMGIEDSQGDPQVAVEIFNKMELTRPPLFYLSFLSNVGVALGPLTDEKKVVLIGLATSAPAFTLGRELVYQYWPTVQADVPPLIRMLQDLRVKKLGIIYSHEDFGIAEQKLVTAACSAAGITVNAQSFETAAADFHQQVEATKGSEAIFVAAVGTSVTSIIRQLRDAKFSGSVLTPPSGANPAFFVLPEMQGVMLVAPIIYNPAYLFAREAGEKFTARYQKQFDHWGASGYDFITLISGLLEDRMISRQGVRDVLAAGFDYSGVFGPVRVRPGDHIIAFPMYPAQIVNNMLKFR